MDHLIRFMMMLLALALLSFLSSGNSEEKHAETKRGGLVLSPEKKVPV